MAAQPVNLGDLLADTVIVYRAFPVEGFRHRKKHKVRSKAYYRYSDHRDGISMGLTPDDAVAHLEKNCGYCSISAASVHSLPHSLEVRPDLNSQGHALILNVPFLDGSNADREMAELIAGKLARLSTLVTCDHYGPKPDLPMPPTEAPQL